MLANLILEGLALCLILTVMCIIGIKDGAAGMAFFYVKEVQDKAIAQGLTTAEKIKSSAKLFKISGILIYVAALMVSVYVVNGARGFLDAFLQMLVIFAVLGLYDRLYPQPSFNYNSTNMEIAIADAFYAASVLYPDSISPEQFSEKADGVFSVMLGQEYLEILDSAGLGYGAITLGS